MSSTEDKVEQLALANCEREQVHQPGRIQSFGILIGINQSTLCVQYASENVEQVLQMSADRLIGKPMDDALASTEMTHALRGGFGLATIAAQRERLGTFGLNGRTYDVAVSRSDSTFIVELECVSEEERRGSPPVAMVRSMMSQIRTRSGVNDMLESAVISLRRLTGFDRVMAYRFLHRGEGEVVAEARGPATEPYLGLRYPASDIPPNVRKLMVKNPFRLIHNIHDRHSPIVAAADASPLDVSLTHLRGVSPIHVEYLENMGVASTMNVCLVVRGQLWGLFAFHHGRPHLLTPEHRSVCELFGNLFSLQLQQQLEQEVFNQRRRADSILRSLGESTGSDLFDAFDQIAPTLPEVIRCDGLTLVEESRIVRSGRTPSEDATRAIIDHCTLEVTALESLDAVIDGLLEGSAAGALVLDLGTSQRTTLVFFREEVIENVRWAGAKDKKVIKHGPNGPRLHPRSSFEEYTESVHGRCEPWTDVDVSAAVQIRSTLRDLLFASRDASETEWKKQKQHQDLLIAELNHRVKNILALVRSIASQTRDSAESLQQYAVAFEQRITALASAHDLIGGSGIQWARLGELLDSELKAFRRGGAKIMMEGPPVVVRSDVAPILALLIHELLSNALKHGALSDRGESLAIAWELDGSGLTIHWRERVQGVLTQPSRRGFGLTLIQRAVPHELEGECDVQFTTDGLEAKIWLPSDKARESTLDRKRIKAASTETSAARHRPRYSAAIVVEDNMVLAMEMESLLARQGFDKIHSFGRSEACKDSCTPEVLQQVDIAVLDINLGTETSFSLAQWLGSSGIPVIFVTGYDERLEIPDSLSNIPMLRKPVDEQQLSETIRMQIDSTK